MCTIEEFDKQKQKVMQYILYKKRTKQEVKNKFSKTIAENILNDIIEYVENAGYINDTKYVEKAINEFMLLNNLSIKEIKYKLYTKGISKQDIENYINNNKEELEEYEIKSAKKIMQKKSISLDTQEIKKYLAKKGYKKENISMALDNVKEHI